MWRKRNAPKSKENVYSHTCRHVSNREKRGKTKTALLQIGGKDYAVKSQHADLGPSVNCWSNEQSVLSVSGPGLLSIRGRRAALQASTDVFTAPVTSVSELCAIVV